MNTVRGFLAVVPRTGQNLAIFIREPIRPLSFAAGSMNFHHAVATFKIELPGSDKPLTLMSAHL